VDAELQQALIQMEARLTAHVDASETRTATRIDQLQTRMDAIDTRLQTVESRLQAIETRLETVNTQLGARIDGVEARLLMHIDLVETRLRTYVEERIEVTETKLLTAFHNWAQTFEVRARGVSAAVREFDERLGMIEERVAKLERSRN
jgi:chaperonin cofactor prefoldin